MGHQQRMLLYCNAVQKSLTNAMNINELINLKIGTTDKTVLTFNRRFLFKKRQRRLNKVI